MGVAPAWLQTKFKTAIMSINNKIDIGNCNKLQELIWSSTKIAVGKTYGLKANKNRNPERVQHE